MPSFKLKDRLTITFLRKQIDEPTDHNFLTLILAAALGEDQEGDEDPERKVVVAPLIKAYYEYKKLMVEWTLDESLSPEVYTDHDLAERDFNNIVRAVYQGDEICSSWPECFPLASKQNPIPADVVHITAQIVACRDNDSAEGLNDYYMKRKENKGRFPQ
jgi:hypothetical protein